MFCLDCFFFINDYYQASYAPSRKWFQPTDFSSSHKNYFMLEFLFCGYIKSGFKTNMYVFTKRLRQILGGFKFISLFSQLLYTSTSKKTCVLCYWITHLVHAVRSFSTLSRDVEATAFILCIENTLNRLCEIKVTYLTLKTAWHCVNVFNTKQMKLIKHLSENSFTKSD